MVPAHPLSSWQTVGLRLLPIGTAGIVSLGGYVLAGGMGCVIALLASLISWASFSLAARRLDAITDLRRKYRTNEFMQESINAIPMPIFVKNRHGRLIMINDAYCAQRQLSREKVLGKTASELAADPDLARLIADEDQTVLNGGRIRKEECIPNPGTGEALHQVVTKALSHTEAGRPIIVGTFFDITNMRVAEHTLKIALEREVELRQRVQNYMQRLIDVIPQPVYVKDENSRYVMVNKAFAADRMLSADQLIGSTPTDLGTSAERAKIVVGEDQSVLAGQVVEKEECTAHPVTGELRIRFISKGSCLDAEGRPVVVGANFDLTALRKSEQNAREALEKQSRIQAFLQFVFDALPTPLIVKDQAHRYLMVNRAYSERLGISAHEAIGRRIGEFLPAGQAASLEQQDDEILSGEDGVIHENEISVTTPQGGKRHELVHKIAGRGIDNQRILISVLTDITSLRETEARWHFALEGAGDGVWDWNIANGKVYYSPRWKAMQGFAPEEISDSPDERTRRIHTDDIESSQAALDVHLSGLVPIYICELRQRRRNGEYQWMLDRGQVVERAPDGTPLRMIGIYTDITHHKHAEEELRRHRDSLKDLVEEQTRDLVAAKEEAERANAAKSQFLANMSHELRTPMHAVLSFAKLGEEKASKALQAVQPTPDKLPTYFQRIRESGDRLLALLNDLLDLSKLEAGHMVLHIQRVDLQSLVQDALHEFEASLLAKRLKARIQDDGCDTLVMADATRMGQVVRNLLSNAIKFSPEDSNIVLSFQPIQNSDDMGRGVEFMVADEGPGVPTEELEAVFDKFVQSSKTRSNAGGTGLGLPICREIIKAHHGEIFARNRASQGTEFVVRVPRHPPSDPQAA